MHKHKYIMIYRHQREITNFHVFQNDVLPALGANPRAPQWPGRVIICFWCCFLLFILIVIVVFQRGLTGSS